MVLVPIPRRKNIQRKVYDRTARAKILISLWSIHSKAWPPQSNCWKRLLKIGKGFIPNFHKWCVCYCALFNQLLAFFRVLFVHQEVALNRVNEVVFNQCFTSTPVFHFYYVRGHRSETLVESGLNSNISHSIFKKYFKLDNSICTKY